MCARVRVHVCTQACTCMRACLRACVRACVCICMHTRTYMRIHVCDLVEVDESLERLFKTGSHLEMYNKFVQVACGHTSHMHSKYKLS